MVTLVGTLSQIATIRLVMSFKMPHPLPVITSCRVPHPLPVITSCRVPH